MANQQPPRHALIAAGEAHTLVRDRPAHILAFGSNHGPGQLGVNEIVESRRPIVVKRSWDDRRIVTLAAGQSHSLALDEEGTVLAWGRNTDYQLGNENQAGSWIPERVPVPSACAGVAAGAMHSFALTENGRLYAWGKHSYGQLGIGGAFDAAFGPIIATPTRVANNIVANNIALIAGGLVHSVAATVRGNVVAWGSNVFGQCGQPAPPLGIDPDAPPPPPAHYTRPVQVRKADRRRLLAASVAAGFGFSVVATPDGKVFTFGGVTVPGGGPFDYDGTPREVTGLTHVTDVAAQPTGSFYVARDTAGRVWKAGPGAPPQQIEFGEKIIAIVAGAGHVVALDRRGGVWTWGENISGQTGVNSSLSFIAPARQPLSIELD